MNKKYTKHALFGSVIALILCCAMLVGTTFAWFTDSVSTGINKIQSGNLDIELYHMDFAKAAAESSWSVGFGIPQDATGEKVEANTKLFLNEDGEEILWEPGATAVESFRIKNEGSLALKYQFAINFANATETSEGKTLADIINISAEGIEYQENGVPTGVTESPATLSDRTLGDGYTFEAYLLPGEQYDFWVGLQWVPSDIDNEFNVAGGLSIDLGVTLVATQYTYEKDNYYDGDQYDADALYPEIGLPPIDNAEDLKAAVAEGGQFKLGADIALDESLNVPAGKTVSLDLAGYDINANYTNGTAALTVEGNLTIINSGDAAAINVTDESGSDVKGNYPAISVKDNAALTFADGVIDVSGFASGIQTTYGSVVNFTGGKIIVDGNNGYGISAQRDTTVNMTGGEIVVNNGIGIFAMWGSPVTVNLDGGKITVNGGSGVGSMEGTTYVNVAKGFVYVGAEDKFIVDMGSNLTVNDNRA